MDEQQPVTDTGTKVSRPQVQEMRPANTYTKDRHGSLPTAADDGYSCSLHTLRSGSPAVASPIHDSGAGTTSGGCIANLSFRLRSRVLQRVIK